MPPSPEGGLAPAKINLALHVTGRRADGFHALDTIAVFADFGDRLNISSAPGLSMTVDGPFAHHAPADEGNLALRAARALAAKGAGDRGAKLTLRKSIPAGAGFGGGSADAASALRLLDRHWGAGASEGALAGIAATIGSDVPMCLAGKALRARGRGEVIEAIEGWPALPLVLIWPGVQVSTAAVFAGLDRRENPPLPDLKEAGTVADVAGYLEGCRNDLEAPALAIAPAIGMALERLRSTQGCLLARMSGSGSGCFGLYPTPEAAEAAARAIRVAEPAWWVRSVKAR